MRTVAATCALLAVASALVAPEELHGEPLAQPSLQGAASAFVEAWAAGDVGSIAATMLPAGIRLHLTGSRPHVLLGVRQARAVLQDFLDERARGELEMERVADLGGTPERGFAELVWSTVADDTSEAIEYTLFIGFQREAAGWRVTEIRVL